MSWLLHTFFYVAQVFLYYVALVLVVLLPLVLLMLPLLTLSAHAHRGLQDLVCPSVTVSSAIQWGRQEVGHYVQLRAKCACRGVWGHAPPERISGLPITYLVHSRQ